MHINRNQKFEHNPLTSLIFSQTFKPYATSCSVYDTGNIDFNICDDFICTEAFLQKRFLSSRYLYGPK